MSTIQPAGEIATRPQARFGALAERRWFVAAVYLMLTVVALYPIFSVTVPPLVDYPNHLARMHILATWDSDPALQKNYVINWSLGPNMAMQLIVPLLAKVVPIYMAGKIFIAMTMLLLLGGTLALRKALVGRVGLWPVLTFLVLYNNALVWGFLNYLFTAGLALFVFSGWIAMRQRPVLPRMVIFTVAAFVLYVGHLFGLFVYGLLVVGYEAAKLRAEAVSWSQRFQALAKAGTQFILPVLLFFIWVIGKGATDGAALQFGTVGERVSLFISPVSVGLLQLDLPTMMFLAVLALICRSDKEIGLVPAAKGPLILLAAVAVLMPSYLSGVWGTHLRLPVIIACMLIAATRFSAGSERRIPFFIIATVALIVVRTAAISVEWREIDAHFSEFRKGLASVDRGARLLPVKGDTAQPEGKWPFFYMRFWHMASLAVIERSAFVPTLFTGHTMVDSSESVKHIDTPVGNPVLPDALVSGADAAKSPIPLGYAFERYVRAYWVGWPRTFDYAFVIHFLDEPNPSPRYLIPVRRGTFFDIYRTTESPAE